MRQVLFCFETRAIQSSKVILREHAFQRRPEIVWPLIREHNDGYQRINIL